MEPDHYAEATSVRTVTPRDLLDVILAMLAADQPLMIWGAPGLGKTDISQLAATMTQHIYHDVRPALMERIDLLGIPFVDALNRTRYASPGFLPPEDSTDLHLVNLEELPNATKDMQAAMYQMVKDRMCGDYKLPEGTRIIACGNRMTDRGGTHRMLAPLGSRFVHVELQPDVSDWLNWAVDNDIDPDVLFFIKFHPDSLNDFDPTRDENTFPCPRTWANLSRVKSHIEDLDETVQRTIYRGAVGETAAQAFSAFLSMKRDLPNPKTVLLDPKGAIVPKNPSAKVAIASSLCRMADEFNMDSICTYADRLGPEVAEYLVTQSLRRCPNTENSDGYTRWASRRN